jgi:PAS domain S-box-containing protein
MLLAIIVIWVLVYFAWRYRSLYDSQQTKVNQLNAIFKNTNEGILFCNDQGKIILANPFIEVMFGYEQNELLTRRIYDLIPKRFRETHVSHFNSFIKNPKNVIVGRDLWAVSKNGLEFPVEINLSHFYTGETLTIIAFIVDATEKQKQKKIERENLLRVKNYNILLESRVRMRTQELEQSNLRLKKSQELYKSIAHNFPLGFIGVLDQDMKYLFVDGTELGVLGLDKDKMLGERIFDDLNLTVNKEAEEQLKKVYKGEKVSFDVKLKNRDYNILATPFCEENNMPCDEVLVVVKNISQRKKLERSLLKTLEKEKELSSLKSRFISTASHEFRTPLSTILSSVFLLENYTGEQLQKESKKLFDRIKRSSREMMELLDEFLSTGKLEEGKINLSYKGLNLPQFMEEIFYEFDLIKKDGQTLRLEWIGDIKEVVTDHQMLKHVLMNLISNSIKYSPLGTTVLITVALDEQSLIFKVRDQGIGIPAEERKYIFKRFFRAHNASGIQGTGLGLNIARKYTHLLGGRINFTSSENNGTTFIVTLPLVSSEVKIK